jgi:hypothetical protein
VQPGAFFRYAPENQDLPVWVANGSEAGNGNAGPVRLIRRTAVMAPTASLRRSLDASDAVTWAGLPLNPSRRLIEVPGLDSLDEVHRERWAEGAAVMQTVSR